MLKYRCAVCRHWCNPVDDGGWICDKRGGCGAEWPEEDEIALTEPQPAEGG